MAVKGALDAALQTFRPHSAALRSPTCWERSTRARGDGREVAWASALAGQDPAPGRRGERTIAQARAHIGFAGGADRIESLHG